MLICNVPVKKTRALLIAREYSTIHWSINVYFLAQILYHRTTCTGVITSLPNENQRNIYCTYRSLFIR